MDVRPNQVIHGDCIATLRQMKPGSVDLVFADPPFNIGYQYDVYDDRRTAEDYLEWSRQWIECVRDVLTPTGTFWLAIGDEFAAELKLAAQQIGFHCRSWVVWYYTFGVNCKRGFSRSHTHLFHLVKQPAEFTFNEMNPAVRVPSARQLVYADLRANPKGRLPDNTWILRPQDLSRGFTADHDTWYYARVAGTFKEREGFHGCQMPEQLLGRIVRISSNPLQTVLDPFAGSGTTLVVAKKLNRAFVGIELSAEYVKSIRQRLKRVRVGDPLNGPADPLRSAPSTRQGKQRVPKVAKAPRDDSGTSALNQIQQRVADAFVDSCQGFSADHLLADPQQNERFVARCRELETPGDPVLWNRTLLRIRKQGKLPRGGKRHGKIAFREMDEYSFASEVAVQLLSNEFGVTLDGILCDPEWAAILDKTADQYAPGFGRLQYRWAALALRKRAKQSRRMAERHPEWRKIPLPRPRLLSRLDLSRLEFSSGVYALVGAGRQTIYVGETHDFRARLDQIRALDAWRELQIRAVRLFPETSRRMGGLKAAMIQRLSPALNWRGGSVEETAEELV